jgi:uncharacterized repeat protein (TIGR03803 family)
MYQINQFLLCAAATMALQAQTFNVVASLNNTDGANPFPALVQATNGDLYGTTYGGGANLEGAIFKVTPAGALTLVYSFCSQTNCTDGSLPRGGLIQDSNGDLYGTTEGGGANNRGTVYKITTAGALTTLYSFCNLAGCMDGGQPYAGLVQASNGGLYGTTTAGGNGFGTIYEITAGGAFTNLYSFCPESQSGCPDGASPAAALVQASNGDFYGTTSSGGANSSPGCGGYNCGTVFKFTGSGAPTTLYSFCAKSGCADGYAPYDALVQATNGDFYGTTWLGGANNNNGTVFQITPTGKLKTLHSFCAQSGCTDGQGPVAGLIQGTDGNLYGTTTAGGIGYGTMYEITLSGTLTTLFSLNDPDGAEPYGGLVQATNGTFYGTTFIDGMYGEGTVYSLSTGLGAFVETLPTSGKVGAAVKILGTNLTGATSVTFNGVAATFKVASSSELTTSVPSGATTGTVKVVTPSGTFLSNVSFRVP